MVCVALRLLWLWRQWQHARSQSLAGLDRSEVVAPRDAVHAGGAPAPRDLHLRAGLGPHLGGQHLFLDRKEWRPTCIAAPLLCPDRLCRWLALLCLVNAGVNRTRSKRVSRGCSLAFIGGFLVALSRCTSFGSLVLVAYTAVCPLSLWRWVPMRVGFTPFDGGRCAFGLPIQDVDPAL